MSWRWPRTAWLVMSVVAVPTALVMSGALAEPVRWAVADFTGLVGALAAAVAFAWTGRAPFASGTGRWWRPLMALALFGWGVGQAVWTWHRSVDMRAATFPDVENALYLGLPVFTFFALLHIAKNEHARTGSTDAITRPRVLVIDGLIVATSLLGLVWQVTFGAAVERGSASLGEVLLAVSYAVADLVLIVLAVLISVLLRRSWRLPLAWLLAGLIAIGASDALYAFSISNNSPAPPNVADVGYMMAPYLVLVAALAPENGLSRVATNLPPLVLPYVPLAAVCAFTAVRATIDSPRPAEVYFLLGVVGLVVVRQLMTARRLQEVHQRLRHLATHDPLTGVANRTLLLDVLGQALPQAHAQHTALGLLYIDLDQFKEVNDRWGHQAGDTVLLATATTLRAELDGRATLARLGGDEFVVLLNPAPADPEALCSRLRERLAEPILLDGEKYQITASFGYVPLEPNDTAHHALSRADAAMYSAKRAERPEG